MWQLGHLKLTMWLAFYCYWTVKTRGELGILEGCHFSYNLLLRTSFVPGGVKEYVISFPGEILPHTL